MADDPIPVTDAVVLAISSQLPDVTDQQVHEVLQTWNGLLSGDPLGTIRIADTGLVGHRVSVDGIHMWRVTAPDGSTWTDMEPTLPWPVVTRPDTTDG